MRLLQPGQSIGAYLVVRPLGEGGMGCVYEVEHVGLRVRRALKVFSAESKHSDLLRKRFVAEGRMLADLRHPRIVRVYDFAIDESAGTPYFAMDLVVSPLGMPQTLEEACRNGVTEEQVVGWFRDICEGLGYIHSKGVVHRDISLDNILIGPDGRAVISDFGIAKITGEEYRRKLEVTVFNASAVVRMRAQLNAFGRMCYTVAMDLQTEESVCIHVGTGVAYDVVVGEGIVSGLPNFIHSTFPKATKLAVVTDSTVDRLHGDRIVRLLEDDDLRVERIVFPAGEQSKTIETYAELVRSFASLRLSRKDLVIALGGGVTGDMAGFAAATYMRGIDFVQVPTSLLAMVDSSVGGKTAVDLPEGKNLVGAFHQPRAVFCDLEFLRTLPEEWRMDGMGEVLKYGILGDAALFARLEANPRATIDRDDIARCIGQKRDIVSRDEFETGERKFLNLGHTFGHAIEKLSRFSVTHGCAVSTGIAYAARAAVKLGVLAEADGSRIEALVDAMGYETRAPYPPDAIAREMGGDKKAAAGSVDLVLPTAIGACRLRPTPLAELPELCQ